MALFSRNKCFYHTEVIFGHKGVKIGESVYFCMRIKKDRVNCWPKIAFYPLKRHFFILGFLRSSCKKGRRKAQKRTMTLIFWLKMPNSILLKVRKNEKDIMKTFWVIKKVERWWWYPTSLPTIQERHFISTHENFVYIFKIVSRIFSKTGSRIFFLIIYMNYICRIKIFEEGRY